MAYSESGIVREYTNGTTFANDLVTSDGGYARGPERALMSALLFDGIQSYMSFATTGGRAQRTRHREAFNWVHKQGGNDYIFSFESVCEALGIDPNFLRYGLLNALNSASEWKKARRNF